MLYYTYIIEWEIINIDVMLLLVFAGEIKNFQKIKRAI